MKKTKKKIKTIPYEKTKAYKKSSEIINNIQRIEKMLGLRPLIHNNF